MTFNSSPATPRPPTRESVDSFAGRLVGVSARRPWTVAIVVFALCALAMLYAAQNFAMTTDTEALISPNVAWRQNEAAMDRAFPQNTDTILVVIDGATPELAESAAGRLTDALSADKRAFKHVERPDGGPFFDREGLLFQSQAEVRATTDQILAAQGFLGPLAADPSLRGVMTSLSALATGVQQGQTSFKAIDAPLRAFTGALQSVEAGRPTFFSWQAMIANGGKGLAAPLRRFITVQPKLNYADLEPGADASDAIRAAAKGLALDGAHGVTVRLTGSVPLSDEEFASLEDKAWLVGGVMLAAMLTMLWLAVRSVQIVLAILLTTIGGLILTAALGLVAVGRFNLISVAFIPLFVGLGVDFGIQLSVRFRAERLQDPAIPASLVAAADGVGGALALAATAIALGFFAFLPTPYVGVSELGVIAGIGMVVALALALTLLPALLVLLKPPLQTQAVGNRALAPVDRFLVERRGLVLWAFAVAMVLSIGSLLWVRFDFNPLHLKNPRGEAMATLADLMKDPDQSPNTIDVLAPSLPAADALAKRLSALPEVSQAVTLSSFVPDDQAAKLALIQNAELLLDPTLNPFDVQPAPSDAQIVTSLGQTASALATAAGASTDPGALDAKRLASVLNQLAKAPSSVRARAAAALIPPLNTLLGQLRALLQAQPETLATLPPALRADWIAGDGRARIQVFPKGRRQRQRRPGPVFPRGAGGGGERVGRSDLDPGGGRHHRLVVHRGGRPVLRGDHPPAGRGAAKFKGDGLHPGADRAVDLPDPWNLRGDRPADQLRQHHRLPAFVRGRRGVPHLFRDGVAGRGDRPSAVEPGAGGVLQRPDHRRRVRQPDAVQPPRHRQHGQDPHDLADLDAGVRAAVRAGVAGAASRSPEGGGALSYFSSLSAWVLIFCANTLAPPGVALDAKSERCAVNWLIAPK